MPKEICSIVDFTHVENSNGQVIKVFISISLILGA